MYYLQSRYYDPELGRFINADAFVSTGQGILSNNMFAYCLNNPISFRDDCGAYAETLQQWLYFAGFLSFVDGPLPAADIILIVGLWYVGDIYLSSDNTISELSDNEMCSAYSPIPPNPDDDDDDDDDYYDNEGNFGSRQKVGKIKGKTPRNNQKQNANFDYAAKKAGISIKKRRAFHDEISGQGYGLEELIEIAKTYK